MIIVITITVTVRFLCSTTECYPLSFPAVQSSQTHAHTRTLANNIILLVRTTYRRFQGNAIQQMCIVFCFFPRAQPALLVCFERATH